MITLNSSKMKEFEEQPQTEPVSFKICPSAKEKIKAKAKLLGIKVSEYMRNSSVKEEIFVILNPSGSIAQGIIEAHSSLNCLIREEKGQEKAYPLLINKLNRIFSDIEELLNELPEHSIKDSHDADNAPSTELKSASVQFYVSKPLKEFIDSKADSLSLDTAQFLRIAALADQPVYVLEKGHYIARYLLEIYDLINEALLNNTLDGKYDKVIQRKVVDILDIFIDVSLRLTNVNNIEGSCEAED